ncbi:MAG: GTPase Era [Acidimicrobiales bacterium]|nr:GTPase Era [Acidimicrobiales bacterium]
MTDHERDHAPEESQDPEQGSSEQDFRSGFVALVGRPNVGKSTLLNKILDRKVSIVSDRPQTTRTQVRGVLNRPDAQVVFVDTPGIHKPRTALGEHLNDTASAAAAGVDVVCLVVDVRAGIGRGDEFVARRLPPETMVVLNKIDAVNAARLDEQREQAIDRLGFPELVAVSARTGAGVPKLIDLVIPRLPSGPKWYPDDMVTDVPEAFWVAELVREQLLARTRDELPHSIATRVTEWDWPYIRCEILVERDSQKAIVIGKNGSVLKTVGTAVREQLPPGAYLDLFVKVDKDWQRRPRAFSRLGY